ncbi:MAG: hypothetical protein U0P45_10080 [Acidimicrobiales bacterium]
MAIVGALAAAVAAALLARSEFRRNQRVKAYSDFVQAFVGVVNSGANLATANTVHGFDKMQTDPEFKLLWSNWAQAHEEYQAARARLELVSSRKTGKAAEEAHEFFVANILSAPPFVPDADLHRAGEFAKQGPGPVARELSTVVGEFTAVARGDLVGRAKSRQERVTPTR